MEYILIKLIIAILIVVVCVLVFNYYELTHFELNEYIIFNDKINTDAEFLILSDLHDNTYGKNNSKLLECINNAGSSNIIIAGDMITGKRNRDWDSTINFLLELAKNHNIYYVNGNHEYRTKIYPEYYGYKYQHYKEILEEAGVIFIENDSVRINNIIITGLEIDIRYYKKFKKSYINIEEIESYIGKKDDKAYNILVAHNPRYIDEYIKWNPDMIISGHFHGGVLRLPYVGGVISPQFDLFPKYSGGLYNIGKIVGIVSKGLGTHSIKIRLFNKPEVIKIKLQKN